MEVKDSKQARVHILYDGRVVKEFAGPMARERYENECRVLNYLATKKCAFVPRVIETDDSKLKLVTSNCGKIANSLSDDKIAELFAELEGYGVRHEDQAARNVTYNDRLGRFCLIDFEFATILETGEGLTLEQIEAYNSQQRQIKGLEELEAEESRLKSTQEKQA